MAGCETGKRGREGEGGWLGARQEGWEGREGGEEEGGEWLGD